MPKAYTTKYKELHLSSNLKTKISWHNDTIFALNYWPAVLASAECDLLVSILCKSDEQKTRNPDMNRDTEKEDGLKLIIPTWLCIYAKQVISKVRVLAVNIRLSKKTSILLWN